MVEIIRQSPIHFDARPIKTEKQGDWEIVLEYDDEGKGPYIIDLSHVPRWDAQDADFSRMRPWGCDIPPRTGDCVHRQGILISRLNQNRAIFYHLLDLMPAVPDEPALTEVTDASATMVLIGKETSAILEKSTALDITVKLNQAPCLLQGPIFHVPCQIVVLGEVGNSSAVVIACPRGYAKSMVDGLFEAGNQWDLRPAGKNAFSNWIHQLFNLNLP